MEEKIMGVTYMGGKDSISSKIECMMWGTAREFCFLRNIRSTAPRDNVARLLGCLYARHSTMTKKSLVLRAWREYGRNIGRAAKQIWAGPSQKVEGNLKVVIGNFYMKSFTCGLCYRQKWLYYSRVLFEKFILRTREIGWLSTSCDYWTSLCANIWVLYLFW